MSVPAPVGEVPPRRSPGTTVGVILVVGLAALFWGSLIVERFGPNSSQPRCGEGGFWFEAWDPNSSALGPAGAHAGGEAWYNLSFLHCADPGLRTGNLTFTTEDDRCAAAPGVLSYTIQGPTNTPLAEENGTDGSWSWGATTVLPEYGHLSIASIVDLGPDLLVVNWVPPGTAPVYSGLFGGQAAPACILSPG